MIYIYVNYCINSLFILFNGDMYSKLVGNVANQNQEL